MRCDYCAARATLELAGELTTRQIFETYGWDVYVTLRCRSLCPDCARGAIAGGYVRAEFRNGRKFGERQPTKPKR